MALNMELIASGASNNWAMGHYTECAALIDEAVVGEGMEEGEKVGAESFADDMEGDEMEDY